MHTKNRVLLLPFVLMLNMGWVPSPAFSQENYEDCLSCHQGIEEISPNHPFTCQTCHLLPEDRQGGPLSSHETIVRNPSDPSHVTRFCLPCHQQEVKKLSTSLHSTMAGVINQTRFLWGAQPSAAPPTYGMSGPLAQLPGPDPLIYPETPEQLVDDYLRKRCLRCHIHTRGAHGPGLYRASGCAACHVIYEDDGRYRGTDQAIDSSLPGYPARHALTKNIPTKQCLHCHNHNHVGTDYVGLFERDYSSTYRRSPPGERDGIGTYGLDHHHLSKDVHAERGMWCIDCHGRSEVMGDGTVYGFQMQVPKVGCTDCHGGFDIEPSGADVPSLSRQGEGGDSVFFVELMGGGGDRRRVPGFSRKSTAHRVSEHKRIRCSACHAQWSYQDYGLSVIRLDRRSVYPWYHLTEQGDPELAGLLDSYLRDPGGGPAVSEDRVSGDTRTGVWLQGWRFRRWELMPLGVDQKGQYSILRPLYQYLVTYVDRLGNVPLDSTSPDRGDGRGRGWAFMPYVPHTTAPYGRACTGCHTSRVAAGLGIDQKLTVDSVLTVASPPVIRGMRLLRADERERLLRPSDRWKRERLKALTTDGGEPQ